MAAATPWIATAAALGYTMTTTNSALAISLAGENGKNAYNSASVVLVAEVFKLALSARGLSRVDGGFAELGKMSLAQWLRFGVPALLYAFNNNLYMQAMTAVPPAAFNLMLQTRVLYTGLFFWVVLGRTLTRLQWGALVGLCVGTCFSQWLSMTADVGDRTTGSTGASTVMTFAGVMLATLYTVVSSFAGVYNEKMLKNEGKATIHLANVPLYAWGLVINLATLMFQSTSGESTVGADGSLDDGFWRGWDRMSTWYIATSLAASGLLISVVVKYFDVVIKILCSAVSNIVVYLVSVMFLDVPLQGGFIVGAAVVGMASYYYTTGGQRKEAAAGAALGAAGQAGAPGGGGAAQQDAAARGAAALEGRA